MLICIGALCMTLMLFCGSALAASPKIDSSPGVDVISQPKGDDLTYKVVAPTTDGQLYLIMIQSGDNREDGPQPPTKANVYYLDVRTASGTTSTFDNIYPRTMEEDGKYVVYLSDYANGGAAKGVALITMQSDSGSGDNTGGTGGNVRYLGDVNNDDDINIQDVIKLLNICINDTKLDGIEFKVANVKSDDEDINIQDVMRLLNMVIADEAKQAVS